MPSIVTIKRAVYSERLKRCLQMIDRLKLAGVDEVACLIDFGVDVESVISNLTYLDQLRERSQVEAETEERRLHSRSSTDEA